MLKQFYEKDKIEVGIDEAGRGCLLGPVCVAAVIIPNLEDNPPPLEFWTNTTSIKITETKIISPTIIEYILFF